MDKTLLPAHDAFEIVGVKHSTGYSQIKAGLLPSLVPTGPQARRAIKGEYLAIRDSLIAQQSEQERLVLVKKLQAARKVIPA